MRRGPRIDPAAEPVGVDHVTDSWSEAFRFAPGHRLRGSRCAHCAALIGSTAVRAVSVTDFRFGPCACGSIPNAVYLVCASHPVDIHEGIIETLHKRWLDHHGWH